MNLIKYNIAIIGLGNIGYLRNLGKKNKLETHFSAISKNKRLKLIGVAEKKTSVLNKFARKNKNIKLYNNYQKLIKENDIDIVVVSTPSSNHEEILRYILKFKFKCVLCEKPISNNLIKGIELIKLFKRKKIPLQINYSRRFDYNFSILFKDLFFNKKIGSIKLVNICYNRGYFNNGSHFLDLVLWFFGVPNKIILLKKTNSKSFKNDLNLDFVLKYKNELNVHFTSIDINKLIMENFTIIGTKGKIAINNNFKLKYYKIGKDKNFYYLNNFYKTNTKNYNFDKTIYNALKNIIDFLDGKDKLLSPGINTMKSLKLIKKII